MPLEIPPKGVNPPRRTRSPRYVERPKVEQGNGEGQLLQPDFDEVLFYDYMAALTIDYLVKNFPEPRLRNLCNNLRDTLDRCGKRLQHLENQRSQLLCTHCQKPLPGGRFAGEIVIRDEITGELAALRACSEPCYREVSRIANERRAKNQGSVRGTVAF